MSEQSYEEGLYDALSITLAPMQSLFNHLWELQDGEGLADIGYIGKNLHDQAAERLRAIAAAVQENMGKVSIVKGKYSDRIIKAQIAKQEESLEG
jgi:hypothetical protein